NSYVVAATSTANELLWCDAVKNEEFNNPYSIPRYQTGDVVRGFYGDERSLYVVGRGGNLLVMEASEGEHIQADAPLPRETPQAAAGSITREDDTIVIAGVRVKRRSESSKEAS